MVSVSHALTLRSTRCPAACLQEDPNYSSADTMRRFVRASALDEDDVHQLRDAPRAAAPVGWNGQGV